jgi:ankyrin repeat protein
MGLDEELFDAVKKGDTAKVKMLLEKGVSVNARTRHDFTPLHVAAQEGLAGVAELLIEYGADVNAKANDGWTPLHIAAYYGYTDVAKLLISHGANVNTKIREGATPLYAAAQEGHAEVAELLISHGADVSAKTNDGWTPLHIAAQEGHAEVVRLLLERGADPTVRNDNGKTPLDLAREKGFINIANLIEEFSRKLTETSTTMERQKGETLQILDVESSSFVAGEWGKLALKIYGKGKATITVGGDIEWLNPEDIQLAGESVIKIPVKPRKSGEVPVKVSIESSGSKTSRIIWLKVEEKAGKCPSCGAPVEPRAKYCWNCGAKLS